MSGSCAPWRRLKARTANLAPLIYGSSCSNGKGRSPRAISVTSAKRVEQFVISRPVCEVTSGERPADRPIPSNVKDRRLGEAAVGVVPHPPISDHAAFRVAQEREGQQQLLNHGSIVLNGIDRDPDEAHGLTDEPVPCSCVRGQLPVAVGSPITAIEDKYNRASRKEFGQVPGPPFLIGQLEVDRLIHPILQLR